MEAASKYKNMDSFKLQRLIEWPATFLIDILYNKSTDIIETGFCICLGAHLEHLGPV